MVLAYQMDLFCSEMQHLAEGAAPVCKKPTYSHCFSEKKTLSLRGFLKCMDKVEDSGFLSHIQSHFPGERLVCKNLPFSHIFLLSSLLL